MNSRRKYWINIILVMVTAKLSRGLLKWIIDNRGLSNLLPFHDKTPLIVVATSCMILACALVFLLSKINSKSTKYINLFVVGGIVFVELMFFYGLELMLYIFA